MSTYRVGTHQPQNLYRGDQYIGVCFDPADTRYLVDVLEERIHHEHFEAILLLGLVRELRRDGENDILTWQKFDHACDEYMARRQEPGTPDVDHARGAAEALAHVADRIANAGARGNVRPSLDLLRTILEDVAAELGIPDER